MSGAPYIVWSPDGPTPPKVSYDKHQAACREAHRLAGLFPGREFFVMARAGKGAKVRADFCTKHSDQLAVVNSDGEFQCQLCADAWAKAEGQVAAEQEAEPAA
jgi:hypothetical protein